MEEVCALPGTGDNFKLDSASAQEAFGRLNIELFGGQLERIPIRLSNAVRKGGSYTAKMFYNRPSARMRRLLRDYSIRDLHDQAITLSRRVILTQEALDRVMAHELIHQWQSAVLGISEDNGGHGETFLSKMGEINAVKGAGFVTVTSDVVAGGTGGRAGQTYYVAIFEQGGRKFGGFSRRPFTENILAILKKTSERKGVPYRVVVTTSHDAQNLTDMSRMKPNSRSRSWTRIPDDIYDAIVSGEVVTAALHRAAARVTDLISTGIVTPLRSARMSIAASSGTIVAYHATLSGSDILEGGFKKSDEVERVGLGGSSMGGSVSFTTDWGVAKGIHKSFVMMHSLVNASDPLAAIREHFESLSDQLAGSVLKFWKSADGGDLQELLGGWKPKSYGSRMQTYDQLVQQGFKPVDAVGGEGPAGDGDTLYYQWLEPVTAEDAERMVYTYVKVYFYANDDEYNPVFMGGDASHFKGIPRDDIGVLTVELHIDPTRKHKNHGEIHRSPGYAILPAESEYRVSDLSMIGEILDYDAHPGDEPKVRADEVSFHSDTSTEEAVNRLLSLLQRHRAIIERGGEIDVRQAMALLRNADDMWDVRGVAAKILAGTKLKHAKSTLEEVNELRRRSQPSEGAAKAIAALPSTVRSEVENAPPSARFSDISERWYDRDEPSYTAWAYGLDGMGMRESDAESEIDDWISSKQWGYEERIARDLEWVKMDVPGFREEDMDEFLELAAGLELATQSKAASTLRIALRTVFEAGDSSKGRNFILRRGKLWIWSSDMGESDEQELVESIRKEFGTDKPPFDQKFPIDSKYRVRDMFEPGLFGPMSDEDMTRFREFASDTLFGMVFPDGRLRARTVAGLPVHSDHPEMEKLLEHLGAEAERPQPKGMWHHGFIATPERMAGVARFGLRPGDAVGESNWENEEYDRSLVYLTTDEMNAKGHATGNWDRYPYAAVVSVQDGDLDQTRMEADFDAERAGFKPGRAAVAGYRGRIPVANFDRVKIYRNGYNRYTTPLLLSLGSDEFSTLAKEYAEWAGRTKGDREALDKEQMHPSFTDRRRVQELHDKIGTDPIRLAVDAKKKLDIAASLRDARLRMGVPHG